MDIMTLAKSYVKIQGRDQAEESGFNAVAMYHD
jgi:hypothetical protein